MGLADDVVMLKRIKHLRYKNSRDFGMNITAVLLIYITCNLTVKQYEIFYCL